MTQKCIVTKLKLYDNEGNLVPNRPPESRLFRPTDSFEDLSTMTMSLQEALSREKMLEDKLILVKSMISKNIGKSHAGYFLSETLQSNQFKESTKKFDLS